MQTAMPAAPSPAQAVTQATKPGGPPATNAGKHLTKQPRIARPPQRSTHQVRPDDASGQVHLVHCARQPQPVKHTGDGSLLPDMSRTLRTSRVSGCGTRDFVPGRMCVSRSAATRCELREALATAAGVTAEAPAERWVPPFFPLAHRHTAGSCCSGEEEARASRQRWVRVGRCDHPQRPFFSCTS
jgi:hypothetical protein